MRVFYVYDMHMPTILIFNHIKICIYFNDHKPEHIHATGKGCEAKVSLLDCKAFFVDGFSRKDIKKIEEFVLDNKGFLLETWRDYHD
jgi:hypothetical protein